MTASVKTSQATHTPEWKEEEEAAEDARPPPAGLCADVQAP